jgi:hypothetical protein
MPEELDQEAQVIDALYRGVCDSEQLAQALDQLCRLVDGAAAVFGEMELGRPPHELIPAGDLDPHFFALYPTYGQFDPLPRAVMLAPEGSVINTARAVPEEERRYNPFVNEMLRPSGFVEAIAARKSLGQGRWSTISILQAVGREPFGEAAEAILDRVVPHLGRALQLRRLFNEQQERTAVLTAIADRRGAGVIALGDQTALFVNETARAIGSAGDGLALDRQGQPIMADREAAKHFAALRADVRAGGPGGIVRVCRPSGRLPYLVLVARLPDNAKIATGTRSAVLIAIHDPASQAAFAPSLVAGILDLPNAAANLVCALLDGEDLHSYAARTGVSINTVRFHLKTAFARTGAHSQRELIRGALIALHELAPLENLGPKR